MRKIFFATLYIMLSLSSKSQVVSTFLNDPSKKVDDGMALDYQGNLYGSHFGGTNVYKITPAGVSTVFATGFNTPNGLAFDSQNNLYVCDFSGNRIYKLSYSGLFLDTIAVATPSGIIKSAMSDTMIFTQYQSNKLNKLAPDGTIISIYSGTPLSGPVGLAYDSLGVLYVGNFNNRKIYSVSTLSSLNYIATIPGTASNYLGFITYANGSLWGTGYSDHKIYKIYQNYTDSVVIYAGSTSGSVDGPISSATFNIPNGIISSTTGDSLYISESTTGKIRIISLNGTTGLLSFNNSLKNILVYPNPSNGYIKIDYEKEIDKIEVYDLQGKLIISTKKTKIDIQQLPIGEYILIIQSENNLMESKFIKN